MKTGLALSGGGLRGLAHLGLLKALDEVELKPDIISGTSAGSVIGALYSYGYSPDEILETVASTSFFRIMKPAWNLRGVLHMSAIQRVLKSLIPEDDFSALKIPLVVAATDLGKGETVYFRRGSLIWTLAASSCIPVLFKPVKYNGSQYVDGGVLNNMPAEPIRKEVNVLIGSNCNPINENYQGGKFKSILERTMLMAISRNVNKSKELCDIIFEPEELKKIGGFKLSKTKEIFNIGYEAAQAMVGDIPLSEPIDG